MRTPLFSILMLTVVASSAFAGPEDTPFISAQINADQKRLEKDMAAGTISKDDGEKLEARVNHVRNVIDTEQRKTNSTRRMLRDELRNIEKDIADKEQAGATSGASPSPTP